MAEESDLTLRIEAQEGMSIRGNRELLSQAVANLLDNALKHGRPVSPESEGAAITVTVAPDKEKPGRGVVVSVADRGGGIPEAERSHVLERFVRL
ncbi:sensor histidine kinase, partial [Parvibaculum sp.]|uniref:sensor histidine kinase n=1 Tax=Parvibaculum sp. TaxID=2024848 RepID=UPI000C8C0B9C